MNDRFEYGRLVATSCGRKQCGFIIVEVDNVPEVEAKVTRSTTTLGRAIITTFYSFICSVY